MVDCGCYGKSNASGGGSAGKGERITDFYTQTSERAHLLSGTEKTILNYVMRNMHLVKDMSIRALSRECYVSTTSLYRFVKKLGFEGYSDFVEAIRATEARSREIIIPSIVRDEQYSTSYLKNVIEAVRVITDEKMERFDRIMSRHPKIFILGQGLSIEVADYFYHLLVTIGYDVEVPRSDYELKSVCSRIKKEDVLLVLSYSGDNRAVISQLESVFAVATPTVISITRADNNTIQNMSDLNFYVFADEIFYDSQDVTSHCGMIAIMEVLLYRQITKAQADGMARINYGTPLPKK